MSGDEQKCVSGTGKELEIYTKRFSSKEDELREITWRVVCVEYLQKLIPVTSSILDIGAGDGHFLRNIKAKRKVALDLCPHGYLLADKEIQVIEGSALDVDLRVKEAVEIVFLSNLLEHLLDKRQVIELLEKLKKVLQPSGRVIIVQPNIRYTKEAYWDYIDHHIALTERSLVEALTIAGYEIEKLVPRFLPYTAKSSITTLLPTEWMEKIVSLYLRFPILWKLFGKQTLVVAKLSEGNRG